MKVIPKSAITTVTAADSKYSRQTDLGGPFGLGSGSAGGCSLWRLKTRSKRDFLLSFVPSADLLASLIAKHPREVGCGGQVDDVVWLFLMISRACCAAAASADLMDRPSARTLPSTQLSSTLKVRLCGGPVVSTTA